MGGVVKKLLPIAGAAIGAYYGGPAGATAGATIGQSIAGNNPQQRQAKQQDQYSRDYQQSLKANNFRNNLTLYSTEQLRALSGGDPNWKNAGTAPDSVPAIPAGAAAGANAGQAIAGNNLPIPAIPVQQNNQPVPVPGQQDQQGQQNNTANIRALLQAADNNEMPEANPSSEYNAWKIRNQIRNNN